MSNRYADTFRFYELLGVLEARVGGKYSLSDCGSKLNWPERGIYFFFEAGELRTKLGNGYRVVRVGTHALRIGEQSTVWDRLSNHRGSVRTGFGNHRGSIFRLLVGVSLANQ